MRSLILAIALLMSSSVSALEEPEREAVKRCQYVSGIAMNVQLIRQETGHTFKRFCDEVDRIYQEGEGLEIIKGIAYKVYEAVVLEATPDEVFTSLYQHCIKIETDKANEEYF